MPPDRAILLPAPSFAALLDWLLAASLALAVLVFLVGVDVRLGGVTVRSHSAARVLAAAAALALVRWRFGIASYPHGSCASRC